MFTEQYFRWFFDHYSTFDGVQEAFLFLTVKIYELEDATPDEKMEVLAVMESLLDEYEEKLRLRVN